jgi:dynein light chain roadblock-type
MSLTSTQQAEIEDTIRRIQTHKGVQGLILTSNDGNLWLFCLYIYIFIVFVYKFKGSFVRSNIDNSTTMSLTSLIRTLSDKAKSCVRDLDPQNDLTVLRIRTKKQEILVAPGIINLYFN